jgi:hypothetical protein
MNMLSRKYQIVLNAFVSLVLMLGISQGWSFEERLVEAPPLLVAELTPAEDLGIWDSIVPSLKANPILAQRNNQLFEIDVDMGTSPTLIAEGNYLKQWRIRGHLTLPSSGDRWGNLLATGEFPIILNFETGELFPIPFPQLPVLDDQVGILDALAVSSTVPAALLRCQIADADAHYRTHWSAFYWVNFETGESKQLPEEYELNDSSLPISRIARFIVRDKESGGAKHAYDLDIDTGKRYVDDPSKRAEQSQTNSDEYSGQVTHRYDEDTFLVREHQINYNLHHNGEVHKLDFKFKPYHFPPGISFVSDDIVYLSFADDVRAGEFNIRYISLEHPGVVQKISDQVRDIRYFPNGNGVFYTFVQPASSKKPEQFRGHIGQFDLVPFFWDSKKEEIWKIIDGVKWRGVPQQIEKRYVVKGHFADMRDGLQHPPNLFCQVFGSAYRDQIMPNTKFEEDPNWRNPGKIGGVFFVTEEGKRYITPLGKDAWKEMLPKNEDAALTSYWLYSTGSVINIRYIGKHDGYKHERFHLSRQKLILTDDVHHGEI